MALRQAFAQMHVHWSFCSSFQLVFQDFPRFSSKYWTSLNTTATPSKMSPPLYSGIDQMDLVQKFTILISRFILDYTTCGFDIGPASAIGHGMALVLTRLRLYRSHLLVVLVEWGCLAPEACDSLKIFSWLIYVIDIKLAVSKSQRTDEMVYDDHLEQFQNISELERALADSDTAFSDITISPFSYRYSVLPSLLWSAVKCRHWQVRHDILYLMYKRPEYEYWDSATTIALKKLIEIESAEIKLRSIVPESARAYWVSVKIQSEDFRVEIWYRRPSYESILAWKSWW